MLVHHFIDGLLADVAQLIRVSPADVKTTKDALAKAQLIMVTRKYNKEEKSQVAACSPWPLEEEGCLHTLEQTVLSLEQRFSSLEMGQTTAATVAQRTIQSVNHASKRCYNCRQLGHIARNCRSSHRVIYCYNCGKPGHSKYQCYRLQGNDSRLAPKANVVNRE